MELVMNNIVYFWLLPLLMQIVLPLLMLFIYCSCYSTIVLFEIGSGHEIRKWWRGRTI